MNQEKEYAKRLPFFAAIFRSALNIGLSWMLIHYFYAIGPSISNVFTVRRNSNPKKLWKLLKKPFVKRSATVFLFLFYVGIPIWFCMCPWIRRVAVYLHFADWPFQTFGHPEYYGLSGTRHFFVETMPGTMLGVWHILPSGKYKLRFQDMPVLFDGDDQPVILYLHGSAESRSAPYRRSMYNVLSNKPIHAHIITFDYRGFGDSTYVTPTAETLEQDASAMYNWLQKLVSTRRIIVWGHSMGTGIAVRLGESLAERNVSNPLAIVLEAPFTSIAAATKTFPLSFFHRHLPFFEQFCIEPTRHPDTNLNSEDRIQAITAPLLILHAADDSMVWSEQGKTLWQKAIESRSPLMHRPVFVELDGKYGCGHRNIHKAQNLPYEIERFLASVKKHMEKRGID